MKVDATKLYDDIRVIIVGPGQECPEVCGESGWDNQGRRECIALDPEQFQPGQVKEARDPSNVIRDSHSYIVQCVHTGNAGDFAIGVFDVVGFHTTDSTSPEDYETRKLYIIVKMKEEIIEQKRDALKRHLIGLLKTISV